jgi:hypothetical protein
MRELYLLRPATAASKPLEDGCCSHLTAAGLGADLAEQAGSK